MWTSDFSSFGATCESFEDSSVKVPSQYLASSERTKGQIEELQDNVERKKLEVRSPVPRLCFPLCRVLTVMSLTDPRGGTAAHVETRKLDSHPAATAS